MNSTALLSNEGSGARPSLPDPLTNAPVWTRLAPARAASRGTGMSLGGFQEIWYLKLNDPASQRALWLRFTLLSSGNGFRRVAETWAVAFQRKDGREVAKTAVKQSHDFAAFSAVADPAAPGGEGVRIGDCELTSRSTRGSISSKGRVVKWDLRIEQAQPASMNFVPETLSRIGLVKNRVATVAEDLRFTGWAEVDGQRLEWTAAPGMQGHHAGPRSGHSWVWGHCNAFVNEQGAPVSAVFEGLSARARLGGKLASPALSTFYFCYQGKEYRFNTLMDAFRARSESSLTDWKFSVERGDIVFRGHARAENRDFAGVTYEDTDGSLLYCANSKLSDLTLWVYRRGKLETTLVAQGTAAFEVVSRAKNPYVPLLI